MNWIIGLGAVAVVAFGQVSAEDEMMALPKIGLQPLDTLDRAHLDQHAKIRRVDDTSD